MRFCRNTHVRTLAFAMLTIWAAAWLSACTADAKYQACSVDSDCKADLGASAYCMHSHCVECVSHASCKNGERCIDGTCEQ